MTTILEHLAEVQLSSCSIACPRTCILQGCTQGVFVQLLVCNVEKFSVIPVTNPSQNQCQSEILFPSLGAFQPGKKIPTSTLTSVHSTLLDGIIEPFLVRLTLPWEGMLQNVLYNSLLLALIVYSWR